MKPTLLLIVTNLGLACLLSQPLKAEEAYFKSKPLHVAEDVNGVDLLSGTYRPQLPTLNIPASGHLNLDHIQKLLPGLMGTVEAWGDTGRKENYELTYGANTSESFTCLDFECTSAKGNGSKLKPSPISKIFRYTQGHTGQVIVFDQQFAWFTGGMPSEQFYFYPSRMSFPNGETLTYAYDTTPDSGKLYHRPHTITLN